MANTTPTLHIKSAARKLPIKRKTPPHSQPHLPSISDPDPNPNPNPNPITQQDPLAPKPEPYVSAIAPHENGVDDQYYDDDDEEAEEEEEEEDEDSVAGGAAAGSGGDLKPPPFKFHRVWSESDEIRFLQGLLGCWSQGMVFPRDLNLFYDRFSESMPQPYTRSQLSEKLRRLRRKFRIMSGRIANGRDPSRLAPHDRDLLHLCTRLWHPSYASSSPFSAPDAAAPAVGNKRRRANPRGSSTRPRARARAVPSSSPPPPQHQLPPPFQALLPAPPTTPQPPPVVIDKISPDEKHFVDSNRGADEEKKPLPTSIVGAAGKGTTTGHLLAETVLDVFDGSLKKLRMDLASQGMLQPDHVSRSGTSATDFSKRWQEQRVAELDVLACRLRLVIEDSIRG